MNPDSPKTPREEMETWLTSLLLGELSEGEAAAVRALMAHDPEMAKLHDRLKETISLVRETVPQMDAPPVPAESLKLSEERRQKLLTSFKTVTPREFAPTKRRVASWLVPMAATAMLVLLLAAIALPNFVRSRSTSASNAVINNIRQIDSAKQQWALEHGKTETEVATFDDIKPYLRGSTAPTPIMGESYVLGKVGEPVFAEVDGNRAEGRFGRLPRGGAPGQRVRLSSDGQMASVNNAAGDQTRASFNKYLEQSQQRLSERKSEGDRRILDNRVQISGQPAVPAMRQSDASGRGVDPTTGLPVDSLAAVAGKPMQIVLPTVAESAGATEGNKVILGNEFSWGVSERNGRGFDDGKTQLGQSTTLFAVDPQAAGVSGSPEASPANAFQGRYAYLPPGSGRSSAGKPGAEAAITLSRERLQDAPKNSSDARAVEDQVAAGAAFIQPTTGLPAQTLPRRGAVADNTTPAEPEQMAFRKRYGLPPAKPAGGTGLGGAGGGGVASSGGIALGLQPSPSQTAPAQSPAIADPKGFYEGAVVRADDFGDKSAPLGDLPTEERFFRSVQPSSETARLGFSLLGPKSPSDKPVLGETLAFGAVAFDAGLQSSDALKDGTTLAGRDTSKDKDSDWFAGRPLAREDGWAARPRTPSVITAGDSLGRQSDPIVLPFVEQENVGAPATDVARREVLARVPQRSLRGSSSAVEAKPTGTTPPARGDEQLLVESRLNDAIEDRAKDRGRISADSARERIVAQEEKSDVMAKVTDGRNLFEAGKVADAEAKFRDAIKAEPENAAANYYLALAKEPRVAVAERGLEQDSKKGVTEIAQASAKQTEDLLPADVINSSAMDLKQLLSIYGDFAGKTILPPTNLPATQIALRLERPMTRQEATRTLEGVLASNGVELVNVGDKFVKAIPLALANAAGAEVARAEFDLAIRKPSTNAPIPQPEIQTSENSFSTFSLNVSDVSFKLAAASLEKGQMPDAASVRTEEFINAFDYRDPEPSPGAPIAFAWERARYPFAHNRDLLRFSLKTAAAGRQAGRPLNIVLLLDNSGSMERADRVRIIREALRVLAEQLQPQDMLSVITFARTPRLVADGISGDKAGEVTEAVSGVTPQGGTNFEEGMNLAYATALRHYLAGGINRVVMLTDGAANLGDVEPESLKKKVETYRKQGVALDCFGIGWEGFNDDLLEVLSRNGDGRYGFINSPEEAATDFAGQLAGALKVAASDVKVQVEFNPKRVTTYRQIGYAKHQLTKEQFRDNTVDAAEIAAQEAGNALYTAEVNPAGEGPLCTVRVRFRFAGTWEYREQAWDVPYSGNAVSLEQSTPAMRLAASASAFAEWLVASPFAGEVTPDRLLGYLSGVPEIYGADARPKKLEWMVRQAKSIAGK